MIDTSLEIIENRNWIAKEGKTISDPLQYGITELMLSFSNNLADKIGCNKICFAHSTKQVKLDRRDKKGRWVEYNETSIRPVPTSYLNTDEYSITLYEQGGIIELFILDVFETGKGLGTKIMNDLLDVADEMNVKVRLIPIAYRVSGTKYFERDCARLRRFYMDLGFTPSSISPYLTYFPVADLFGKV